MIDVSQHQGTIRFDTMRARGVDPLVLRATHGSTVDARVRGYWRDATAAGYEPHRIGFYTFINPKRGSAAKTATDTANLVREITGRTDALMMLDVEDYRSESPDRGAQPLRGAQFARYLREWAMFYTGAMPGSRIIAYSNRAYWDGPDGPRDPVLAAELEWMVPRYPRYSSVAYQRGGYPPTPDRWDEYAFAMADGPHPPNGSGVWEGWQFSAGFNRQGPVYGCQSSDLDLNIIRSEAVERWFPNATIPPPPIEEESDDDMQIRFTTPNRLGQFLIGSGLPLMLTDDMVAAEPFKSVPLIVGKGDDDDARWDQYAAIFEAAQVAPTAGQPPVFPPITGTFTAEAT